MIRATFLAIAIAVCAAAAAAQDDPQTIIGRDGLVAAEAALSGAASNEEHFLLGAVRFLRGAERAMQTRWRMGLNSMGPLPILRLGIPANPAPEPFRHDVVETIFSDLLADMTAARSALERIDGTEFSVPVDMRHVWLDVNANGKKEQGEELLALTASSLGARQLAAFAFAGDDAAPVVDFDRADVDWMIAYTHFLSGIAEVVLGFRPSVAIERVIGAEAQIAAITGDDLTLSKALVMDQWVRLAAVYLTALESQPDAANGKRARQHFLAMIAANRAFWAQVEAETDQGREWIPNDTQTSGFGMTFPAGTGAAWLAVLSEAEAVLTGDRLIPFWRTPDGTGLNLARMLDDPPAINLIGWIHGMDALPYLERGQTMSRESWPAFERLMSGRGILFAVMLN